MVERSKDERGIPHTTMRDGAPNGYSIITFDGAKATFDFKASRFPRQPPATHPRARGARRR